MKNKTFRLQLPSPFSFLNSQGFTMIEMLVYMVILLIMVSILSVTFRQIIDLQLNSQATAGVDQDGRFIIARLTHDMQAASQIVSPATPGAQLATLQLKIPGNTLNYIYSLNNSNLQLTNDNGTDVLNSVGTTVSGLTFQRLGNGDSNDTIRVSFTMSSVTKRGGVPETRTYQTTLGLH
jgi:prepilin-type N-terminal cleavage/methylation domain-containing protein